MIIRLAEPKEYAEVRKHYEVCCYSGGLNESDLVVIAFEDGIVGAVRICAEDGVKVLRGMYLKPEFRGRGIGRSMLAYLKENMDIKDCYSLPFKHLVKFYGKIGFEEIGPEDAPAFLAARLEKYRGNGSREIIIMKVKDDI